MKTLWKACTIQDLQDKGEAELKTGPFGTQLHASDYVEEGTPVINVRNIGFGNIREEKLEFISDSTVQRLSSHLLLPGDIVFGRKGAVERHTFIREEQSGWFQGSDCLRLRIKGSSIEPRFLSYYFLTEAHQQWMMNQCSHGSTMASLNQAIISRIPLLIPPVKIQRRILDFLSPYDRLIENNTRRIKILEEMAQLLYQEWFVNFRFPGHEQVKMVESAIGLIPEGWEVKKLEEVVTEIIDYRGKTPKKLGSDWSESGHIAISAKNIKEGKLISLEKSKYVDEELYKKWMKSELMQGDILMTSEAPLGELYYLVEDKKFCLSQRVFSIRANSEKVDPILLYLILGSSMAQKEIHSRSSGTTVLGIRQSELRKVPLMIPQKALQEKISPMLKSILKSIEVLESKNINLRKTRDLLLPKLISGEIDVEKLDVTPEAEAGELAA